LAQPAGEPISKTVRQGSDFNDTKRAALVQRTLALIDRVHGGGQQGPVDLVLRPLTRTTDVAGYNPSSRVLVLSPQRKQEELDVIHEIGHMLDHQAIGNFLEMASVNGHPNLATWRVATENSQAVTRLRSLLASGTTMMRTRKGLRLVDVDPGYVQYLMRPEELFARSYAQFVAVSSGDVRLLAQLGRLQNRRGNEIGYNPTFTVSIAVWH
jgi:hypothetical protein